MASDPTNAGGSGAWTGMSRWSQIAAKVSGHMTNQKRRKMMTDAILGVLAAIVAWLVGALL